MTGQERPPIRTKRAAVTGTGRVAVVKASTLEVGRRRLGFSVYGRGSGRPSRTAKESPCLTSTFPRSCPASSAPWRYRPETAKPLNDLAEVLLRERAPDNHLTRGERELIAAYVSRLNDCHFCHSSHAAFAAPQLDDGWDTVDAVSTDLDRAPISAKLRALLRIAGEVREGGRNVTPSWWRPPAPKGRPTSRSTTPC